MRIPKIWASAAATVETASGKETPLKCFGWSDSTMDEARSRASEALARLSARVRSGAPFPEPYTYASRPIREQILEELRDRSGEIEALVTRNGYGAEVLNTARLMFVDIDDPPESGGGIMALFRTLFGGAKPVPAPDAGIPVGLSSFAESHPQWGFRVYRTRAGWRVLVTHDLFDPASRETAGALAALGCDPKYVELTRVQQCFRARLTPKPWRCGVRRPERLFPREDVVVEREFAEWVKQYETAGARFATCKFVGTLGRGRDCETASRLIARHDRGTRTGSDLPLA